MKPCSARRPTRRRKAPKRCRQGRPCYSATKKSPTLRSRCREISSDDTDPVALKAAITKFLKEEKKNIEAMKLGSGLESALFGRMVTSDLLANRDAAVSVAHAFTVHEAQVENDYFTVVDDFAQEEDGAGSAGIFDTELASGLYYGYVVIDVPQLVANLEGIAAKTYLPAAPRRRSANWQVR